MSFITSVIDFILGLFRKKSTKLKKLEKKRELLQKALKEIDDEDPDTDSNIDYINTK
jgi:hypothetical protein